MISPDEMSLRFTGRTRLNSMPNSIQIQSQLWERISTKFFPFLYPNDLASRSRSHRQVSNVEFSSVASLKENGFSNVRMHSNVNFFFLQSVKQQLFPLIAQISLKSSLSVFSLNCFITISDFIPFSWKVRESQTGRIRLWLHKDLKVYKVHFVFESLINRVPVLTKSRVMWSDLEEQQMRCEALLTAFCMTWKICLGYSASTELQWSNHVWAKVQISLGSIWNRSWFHRTPGNTILLTNAAEEYNSCSNPLLPNQWPAPKSCHLSSQYWPCSMALTRRLVILMTSSRVTKEVCKDARSTSSSMAFRYWSLILLTFCPPRARPSMSKSAQQTRTDN